MIAKIIRLVPNIPLNMPSDNPPGFSILAENFNWTTFSRKMLANLIVRIQVPLIL